MAALEVSEPIINSPFEEPKAHWHIVEGETPEKRPGRRPAAYEYIKPGQEITAEGNALESTTIELKLVSRIRKALGEWRKLALRGEGGVTRTTMELLRYWRRDGREHRLFFAQLEAAETVIFLNEARADFLQGIEVPLDAPGEDGKKSGLSAFQRYACKMATGTGKTTVMAMLAAWSILNKVNNPGNKTYSDAVLVICPNVTIRTRLGELDPKRGAASLYRSRDLVPAHLMADLAKGRLLCVNWHVFEPQGPQVGGETAKVLRAGMRVREMIYIGDKTTTARGRRYMTWESLQNARLTRRLEIVDEFKDDDGRVNRVLADTEKYLESDAAVVKRVLGRDFGNKQNILVLNDEAHHAYRIRQTETQQESLLGDETQDAEYLREATVWVDGLDRMHKLRGINFCADFSATPYFLARAGENTNRIFPWVVSEFGLSDAIESGLVKIPQLAVRDTTGSDVPGYFNIWRWIIPQLTRAERGGGKGMAKPEAILKYANVPTAMLGGLWNEERLKWEKREDDARSPVLIVVCKNTKLAKIVYEWLADNNPPAGIPPANLEALRNTDDAINTIRVDSKVVQESDSGNAKTDEMRWMRLTLDTIGKTDWPADRQGRPVFPQDFEELAGKLGKPLHPPGRDVRCIVSVGMLTEGWDCNTVTHIVGLRPFMSQLLSEQVVGRGLRRAGYDTDENGMLSEEIATVFGVPFTAIPLKKKDGDDLKKKRKAKHHIHAIPQKADLKILFPRVEGYRLQIKNRIQIDWDKAAGVALDPGRIPPEVEMKAALPSNAGRPSLSGPGKLTDISLNPYRRSRRLQQLTFEMAKELTKMYCGRQECAAPPQMMFPQMLDIIERYLQCGVEVIEPCELADVFLSPWYGWVIENLQAAIKPDTDMGEAHELPRYEANRGPGTTEEVNFYTTRKPYPVVKSHVNAVVPDTDKLEQSAAYRIDKHPRVRAFVKNEGLGFAVPYQYNGEAREYLPDFIIASKDGRYLILETKGYDPMKEIKKAAAERWVDAVNAEGSFGLWAYRMVDKAGAVKGAITAAFADQV